MKRVLIYLSVILAQLVPADGPAILAGAGSSVCVRVACVGDSITQGAGVTNRLTESYPARLQALLGSNYEVQNLGVGGCTLIRKGQPNVWSTLRKLQSSPHPPDMVVISLGINDTCGDSRRCWDHRGEFADDYRDLIDALRALPSTPSIWICAPTPMVIETPGLKPVRIKDLQVRRQRLAELIRTIESIAQEKQTGFIDLNTPLAGRPELFTDGVHMRDDGYQRVAELVADALR